MDTWAALQFIWYLLIGVLLAGYSLLDGFDLGIGVLTPFVAKSEKEKKALYHAIGPFWDGNEVWLLTGGGALFAAFPHAYATVFSGFYLALMLVLLALILRAVSLDFASHDSRRKGLWELLFTAGSLLPALLFGVALGNVVAGVPLDARMEYTGTFFTLLRPLPLAFGLLGLTAFLVHGSAFAAMKVEGELLLRVRQTGEKLTWVCVSLFALAFVLGAVYLPGGLKKPLAWVFTALFLAGWGRLHAAFRAGRDGRAFLYSSVAFASLWGIVGAVHFPNLVLAANDPALSLTAANASSSRLTLTVMLIIALIGMPLVVGYTIYSYKVFRGRVRLDEGGY
jgi:cytochrome d ubiquinol oxidase subunit II